MEDRIPRIWNNILTEYELIWLNISMSNVIFFLKCGVIFLILSAGRLAELQAARPASRFVVQSSLISLLS